MLRTCINSGLLAVVLLTGCAGLPTLPDGGRATADPHVGVPPAVAREYARAVAELEAGNFDRAERELQAFIERYPEYPAPYVNLAIVREQQSRTDDASALLGSALERDPGFAPALNRLGLMKRRQGDFAGAEETWLALTRAEPDYAYAWYNLGVLYDLYLQDLPAAITHYKRYQELDGAAEDAKVVASWIADLERRAGVETRTARTGGDS